MSAAEEALATLRTTAPVYFKEATDHTIRNRLLLKLMEIEGNVVLNMKAPEMIWDIEVREPKIRALDGGADRHVWNESEVYEQLKISHAELEGTDIMRRRFQMINSDSPNAIVEEAGKKMDRLVRSLTRKLNSQFYFDNTGANSHYLTGIKSFLKYNSPGAGTDWILSPSSAASYGGMSVELGSLGGVWSEDAATSPSTNLGNDWPLGSGSSEYDFNSPKMINTNGAINGASGWTNNCLLAIRRMTRAIESTGGQGTIPIVQLFSQEKYSEVEDKLEERERLFVSDYAQNLGFPRVLTYGGALLATDYDCPADEGFAVNPEKTCLYSVHSDLFFTDSDWSTESQLSAFLVGFLGNWVHTPKYVGAYYAA